MTDRSKQDPTDNGYGTLVLMVGPSGSGKDSVINHARKHFTNDSRVLFVKRAITRDNGDPSEDHESMSVRDFQKAEMRGEFVLSWGAHGLYYGLPASLLDHLETGGVAVANGSRKTIPLLRKQFPNLEVVNLSVDPAILAKRLAARGRESAEEIERRLARSEKLTKDTLFDEKVHHIDNSGDLSQAGSLFIDLISNCLKDIPVASNLDAQLAE